MLVEKNRGSQSSTLSEWLGSHKRETEILFLAIVLLMAFLLRLFFQQYNTTFEPDEAEYSQIAQNIAEGRGFTNNYVHFLFLKQQIPRPETYHNPLFPYTIALFYGLFGVSAFSAKLVSVFFGTILVISTYLLARKLFGQKAARISALLTAFQAFLVFYSTQALTQMLFISIVMLAVLFLHKSMVQGKTSHYLISGILLGIGYLVRAEAVIFLASFYIARFLLYRKQAIGKNALLLLAVFLLIISPLLIRNFYVTENLFYSEKAYLTGVAWEDKSDEENYFFDFYAKPETVFQRVLSNPLGLAHASLLRLAALIISTPVTVEPLIFILSIYGATRSLKEGKRHSFIYVILALFYAFYSLNTLATQYFLVLVAPFFIIFASFGIIRLSERFKPRAGGFVVLATAAVVIVSMITGAAYAYVSYANEWNDMNIAGAWLKEQSSSDTTIMSRKSSVAYYAGTRWVPLPTGNFSNLMEAAKMYNATYLVFDERKAAKVRPDLRFLLDKGKVPNNLEPVYELNRTGKSLQYSLFNIVLSLTYDPTKRLAIYRIKNYSAR